MQNFLVAALDEEAYRFAFLQGLPVYLASTTGSFGSDCLYGSPCFKQVCSHDNGCQPDIREDWHAAAAMLVIYLTAAGSGCALVWLQHSRQSSIEV